MLRTEPKAACQLSTLSSEPHFQLEKTFYSFINRCMYLYCFNETRVIRNEGCGERDWSRLTPTAEIMNWGLGPGGAYIGYELPVSPNKPNCSVVCEAEFQVVQAGLELLTFLSLSPSTTITGTQYVSGIGPNLSDTECSGWLFFGFFSLWRQYLILWSRLAWDSGRSFCFSLWVLDYYRLYAVCFLHFWTKPSSEL